jgi:hypothetical protein
MSKYLNENGLVNGLIPAGEPCPFLDRCKFKVHTCPGVDGKMKVNHFSCAAARLHSTIRTNDQHPLPMLRGIVEKPADPFTSNEDEGASE